MNLIRSQYHQQLNVRGQNPPNYHYSQLLDLAYQKSPQRENLLDWILEWDYDHSIAMYHSPSYFQPLHRLAGWKCFLDWRDVFVALSWSLGLPTKRKGEEIESQALLARDQAESREARSDCRQLGKRKHLSDPLRELSEHKSKGSDRHQLTGVPRSHPFQSHAQRRDGTRIRFQLRYEKDERRRENTKQKQQKASYYEEFESVKEEEWTNANFDCRTGPLGRW